MSVTIREVAKRAGVSAGTVSLVLNKKPGISDATRTHVEEAVKALNYTPNAVARRLVTRQIRTIGVIYSEHLRSGGVPCGFMMDVFEGIRSITDSNQANLILVSVADEFREDHLGVHMMHKDKLDGVMLVAVEPDSPYLALIRESGLPFIDINRRLEDDGTSYVVLDYEGASEQAISHLQACGYDKIGVLVRPERPSIARDILEGYRRALGGEDITPDLVREHDGTPEGGRQAMELLLDQGVTGVFVSDNAAAAGAVEAALCRGHKVPDDIGIVGMYDYSNPDPDSMVLTHARYPTDELGRTAVDTLLRLMENPNLAAQRSVVRTYLVQGASTPEVRAVDSDGRTLAGSRPGRLK